MFDLSLLSRAQKMELLAMLIEDLKITALTDGNISDVIVADFVKKKCKFCGDDFHGKESDLHCPKPNCYKAWFELNIQSKLDIARLNNKKRSGIKNEQ